MAFDLESACDQNGLPYDIVLRLLELYLKNEISPIIYNAVGGAVHTLGEELKAEILSEVSKVKTPKLSKSASGGKSNNPDYAPNREGVLCSARIGSFVSNESATVIFESLAEKNYGLFFHTQIMTQHEILSLFFNFEEEGEVSTIATAAVKPEIVGKIADLSDMRRNAGNLVNYNYLLDVKRKVARKDEPHEVLSITPYEAKQNEPGK